MESLREIVHDRVHNQRWFTGRGLKSLADATGWSADSLAKLIAGILFWLLVSSSNWIVCNSVLVVVPMLLTYVYPDERPPVENMRVFWISAFVMTAFDRMLEAFPFYYVGKLCALLFLLVEPSCLNEKLKKLLKVTAASHKAVEVSRTEKDVATAKQPASAWSRFTDSIKTAIGGTSTASASTSKPPASSRKTTSSLISQPTGQNIATNTPDTRSRSLSGDKSASVPTPYDAKPVSIKSKPMFSSGESVGRASVATGPPVGVGEKQDVSSMYISLPKPVTKQYKEATPARREGSRRSGSKPVDTKNTKRLKK